MSEQESGTQKKSPEIRDVILDRDANGREVKVRMYVPKENAVLAATAMLSRVANASKDGNFESVVDDIEMLLTDFVGPLFVHASDRRDVDRRLLHGDDITRVLIAAMFGDYDTERIELGGNREQRRNAARNRGRGRGRHS